MAEREAGGDIYWREIESLLKCLIVSTISSQLLSVPFFLSFPSKHPVTAQTGDNSTGAASVLME